MVTDKQCCRYIWVEIYIFYSETIKKLEEFEMDTLRIASRVLLLGLLVKKKLQDVQTEIIRQ